MLVFWLKKHPSKTVFQRISKAFFKSFLHPVGVVSLRSENRNYCFVTPELMGTKIASTARSYQKRCLVLEIGMWRKYFLPIILLLTEHY